jgi:hypothetical protein
MPVVRPLLTAIAVLALCGCVVAPYPGYAAYGGAGYNDDIAVVGVAPPPPYAEVVPVAPFIGAVWLAGYWGWVGGRHQWSGGHWEHPRPGYAWAPHHWVQQGNQWHLRGGGWVRH